MDRQSRSSNLDETQDPSSKSDPSKSEENELSDNLMNIATLSSDKSQLDCSSSPPEGIHPDVADVTTFTPMEATSKSGNCSGML